MNIKIFIILILKFEWADYPAIVNDLLSGGQLKTFRSSQGGN